MARGATVTAGFATATGAGGVVVVVVVVAALATVCTVDTTFSSTSPDAAGGVDVVVVVVVVGAAILALDFAAVENIFPRTFPGALVMALPMLAAVEEEEATPPVKEYKLSHTASSFIRPSCRGAAERRAVVAVVVIKPHSSNVGRASSVVKSMETPNWEDRKVSQRASSSPAVRGFSAAARMQ